MSCKRTIVTHGAERILRFNCEGCDLGASIERSETCMSEVVEALLEHPDVGAVVLTDVYEREYTGPSLEALKEVAEILGESRRWFLANLTPADCNRCEPDRRRQLEDVLQTLPRNPSRALEKLKTFLSETIHRTERGARRCRECHSSFLERSLKPISSSLKRARLVERSGGRDGYAGVLQPSIRPCLLASRVKVGLPSNCELVDAYEVEGNEVKVYFLPEKLENLYFLTPSEYHLTRDQVQLLRHARMLLLEKGIDLDPNPLRAREQVRRACESLIAKLVIEEKMGVDREEVGRLAQHLARFTAGFGLLEILLADPRVQDIYVDAPVGETPVHIYHMDHGECSTNIFLTPEDVDSLISRFRAISGRPFSEADPVLDLNLEGVRVAAIGKPLSPEGTAFALRRHKPTPWTLPQFIRAKFLTPLAAGLLSLLVDAQSSILVTGSRGSGKTSLLGGLMLEILPKFRIITLEDTPELPVNYLRSLGFKIQSLKVQSAVSGAPFEFRAEDALKAALRLGESVLIVGEVRSREAQILYEAMRVGSAGNSVMGTIHGATARDVFERVVHDLGIPPSSFKATDVIVVASPIRLMGGINRTRRVLEITEVGKDWREDPQIEGGFRDLMRYDFKTDKLKPSRELQESELLSRIARKWAMNPRELFQNLDLRSKLHATLVDVASKKGPEFLEAEFVVESNLRWHSSLERHLKFGRVNYEEIFDEWCSWLKSRVGLRKLD